MQKLIFLKVAKSNGTLVNVVRMVVFVVVKVVIRLVVKVVMNAC